MPSIKHKNYLLFAIILIVLGIFLVLIYPQVGRIKENNKKISEEKIKLQNNIESDKKIKRFQADKEGYSEFKNNLVSALVNKENKLDLIIPLENIASELDLRQNLEFIEAGEDQAKNVNNEDSLDKLAAQKVRLQLEGEYKNFLRYFSRLNQAGIMYDIDNFEIKQKGYSEEFNKKPDESNQGVTQAILEIKIFTQ